MIRFATVMAVLLATGTANATPYDGLYRPDAAWADYWNCKTIGLDGGAMSIAGNVFTAVENQCTLTNPTAIRDMDATLYDVVCSAEGDDYFYRMMILKTDTGVTIIHNAYSTA
jgi:hypothetical protein